MIIGLATLGASVFVIRQDRIMQNKEKLFFLNKQKILFWILKICYILVCRYDRDVFMLLWMFVFTFLILLKQCFMVVCIMLFPQESRISLRAADQGIDPPPRRKLWREFEERIVGIQTRYSNGLISLVQMVRCLQNNVIRF